MNEGRKLKTYVVSVVVILLLFVIGGFVRLGLVRTPVGDAETGLSDLRSLYTSLTLYYARYQSYPASLAELGPPPTGTAPSATAAGLVDEPTAAGQKFGYRFTYHAFSSSGGNVFDKFAVAADPVPSGPPRGPHYLMDQDLVIRMEAKSPATAASPQIN